MTANGVFGRKNIAIKFAKLTNRSNPIVYEVTIKALIDGLKNSKIRLVSEHDYDLRILSNDNHNSYLEFCKKYLKYEIVEIN